MVVMMKMMMMTTTKKKKKNKNKKNVTVHCIKPIAIGYGSINNIYP